MKYSPHDPLQWIESELTALEAQNLRRHLHTHAGRQQVRLEIGGVELINFGSNDYLALAADPRLIAAAARTAEREGWGAGSSPLVTGHTAAHEQLERRLADFEGTEAALVFSSGYAANIGAITALADHKDAIYSDEKNHASMIDGCRLSRAEVHVYPHGNSRDLEHLLRQGASYRRRLIITESVFSMDGDFAPLEELVHLAERYDCMLLVDEAHATGVFGSNGRGLAEALGIDHRISVRIGTLSKALGCAGGFVCGSQPLIEWLVNRARGYVFSTASPPAVSAAAVAALDIVRNEPGRRTRLLEQAGSLRNQLRQQGWQMGGSASQIIPLVVGDAAGAMRLSSHLRGLGLLVPAIRPPSVPTGQSLVRISLSFAHTDEMLARLVAALAALRREFETIEI